MQVTNLIFEFETFHIMAKHFFVIAALVVAASATLHHKDHRDILPRKVFPNVDYYYCHGLENGNYTHPRECTRYITCHDGIATDNICPECDYGNPLLCRGSEYDFYDGELGLCVQPHRCPCIIDDPGTRCEGKVEGSDCPKEDCEHCGWCLNKKSQFLRCNRTEVDDPKDEITGTIIRVECDDDLWWNPVEHVGPDGKLVPKTCVKWESLTQETKDAYNADPNCVRPICYWGQDADKVCTGSYFYFDPPRHLPGERDEYNCPINDDGVSLVWDPKSETCRNKDQVEGC